MKRGADKFLGFVYIWKSSSLIRFYFLIIIGGEVISQGH